MSPSAIEVLRAYDELEQLCFRLRRAWKLAHRSEVEFVTEAWTRAKQVRYALGRFVEVLPSASEGDVSAAGDAQTQLEFYAEAFYLFAWRLRESLTQVPEFKNFMPVGVRTVRNWLIEHVEDQPEGVVSRNFKFDCEEGFVLKPFGGVEGRAVDRGLYPNAAEFASDLAARITTVLAAFEPPRE